MKKTSKTSRVLDWLDAKQKCVSLESPRQNKNTQKKMFFIKKTKKQKKKSTISRFQAKGMFAYSAKKGCSSASSAEIRSSGLSISMRWRRSIALGGALGYL
jgi:hypothetical protein